MPISVFHALTATTPDNTSYEIRPQAHWNAPHVVSLSLSGSEIIGALSNANGVSFGTAPNGQVTASVAPPGISLSAGLASAVLASVIFSNANGASFGLNGSTLTASFTQPSTVGLLSAINFSGGTSSVNTNALVFSNSNNVNFGLSGNSITASAIQTSLNFSNANNVSFTLNGSTLQASASFPAASSVTFSNLNNVSFSVINGSVFASASQSIQTQGQQALSILGNTSGTLSPITSGTAYFAGGNNITLSQLGNSITISGAVSSAQQTAISAISAGTSVVSAGTISFANLNNVSFGIVGNTITASIPSLTGIQTGISGIAIAGATITSGTVTFSNANGLSFGTNGANVITASYTVPTQSVQAAAIYLGTTNTFGTSSSPYNINSLSMVGSGEISLAWSNNSLIISTPVGNFDSLGVSNLGNTGGATGLLSQQAVFVGSNYVTLSQATGANGVGTISILGPNPATAISGISAGSQLLSSGTLVFSNANGMTFGLNNSSLTASYSVPSTAGLLSAVNFSAGTTQSNYSNIAFGNANSISFGLNAGTITASFSTNQSAQTGISGFAAGSTTFTSGTITLSNANGISFGGFGANVVTASYTVPSVAGLLSAVNVSAGSTSSNLSNFVFSNANAVSFGMQGNTITASIPSIQGAQTGISGVVVGNTTFSSGTLSFINTNGISFGSSGPNGITASYTVPTQSTQPMIVSGSNGSFAASTIQLGAANGLTLYTAPGGSIVGSYSTTVGIGLSAGTQSAQSGVVQFSNANGISFGLASSSVMTASYTVPAQSNQAVSGSNGSISFQTLSFGNLNGLSFYTTNGSLVGSYSQSALTTNGLISNVNVSAGTTSQNLSAFAFSNSNNISFGLNGSTITASFSQSIQTQGQDYVSAIGNVVGAASLVSSGTLFLAGGNNITLSQNGNSLTLSGPNVLGAQTGISGIIAGSQTQTVGTVSFSNANGISFGLASSSVMTASYTVPTQSVQSLGVYAVGTNTVLGTSGTIDARFLSLSGFGLASVGVSNGSIVFSNSGSQSNQSLGLTVSGNQTYSTTATIDARSLYISAAGNITAGYASGSIVLSGSQVPMLVGVSTFGNTAGNTALATNQVVFVGGNNITLSGATNNSGSMTVSIVGPGGIAAAAGTQTALSGTLSFSNTNGVSFGLLGSSILTASISAPVFSNSNNVTFGTSNSSIVTASFSQSVQPVNVYVSSQTLGNTLIGSFGSALSIVGSGDISVGFTNGSLVFAGAGGVNNLAITGAGGITLSTSNGSLVISAPTLSSLSAVGGIGISTSGSTISLGAISVTTNYFLDPTPPGYGIVPGGQLGQGSVYIVPFPNGNYSSISQGVAFANLSLSTSSNSSFAGGISLYMGAYTRNGSTLSLASSGSQAFAFTNSSSNSLSNLSGYNALTVPIALNLSPGDYWFGFLSSTSSTNANWFTASNVVITNAFSQQINGLLLSGGSASFQPRPGIGRFSATSYALPVSMAFSAILGQGQYTALPYMNFNNFSV